MWLVMKIIKDWETEPKTSIPKVFKLENPDIGLIGLCPVFDTEEQARVFYPNENLIEVNYAKRINN